MSYASINGMRSTRYPLQGLGCCGGRALGQSEDGGVNPILLILGAAAVVGIGSTLYSGSRAVRANRRRMRANRRRGRRRR